MCRKIWNISKYDYILTIINGNKDTYRVLEETWVVHAIIFSSEQTRMVLQDDTHRTRYQPQVRILKRPTGGTSSLSGSETAKDLAQPVKTLQQREAEYAEARLRIMGASSKEETLQNSIRYL